MIFVIATGHLEKHVHHKISENRFCKLMSEYVKRKNVGGNDIPSKNVKGPLNTFTLQSWRFQKNLSNT